MKINRLDTHDKFQIFQQQQNKIAQGLEECIRNVPESVKCPFYAYAHSRQVGYDEKISIMQGGHEVAPDERLIWMPVVTKPKASSNSYLFLCRKGSDVVEIIWMIPKIELWDQFAPGKMCHNENIWTSIQNYQYHRAKLNSPDKNGPTLSDVEHFRKVMGEEAHKKKSQKIQKIANSKWLTNE